MTGGQVVTDALDAWDVEILFGISGIHTLSIYDALHQHPRIRHVTARHEQGAGFMADGYARATGKVGVVLTTTGPAAVNALTPLAQAYAESSAVLMIASGPPTDAIGDGVADVGAAAVTDRGVLHEMADQFATLRSVCERGCRVSRSAQIPEAIAKAFVSMEQGRPRPFVLEIPLDVLEAKDTSTEPLERVLTPPLMPDPAALPKAAELVTSAARPLIIAGRGAQGASPEIIQLAELLNAPVALTTNGLGVIPADHPLCLPDAGPGSLEPLFRSMGSNMGKWVAQADLCIAVGTRLGERSVKAWDAIPKRLIHLDVDASIVGRHIPLWSI